MYRSTQIVSSTCLLLAVSLVSFSGCQTLTIGAGTPQAQAELPIDSPKFTLRVGKGNSVKTTEMLIDGSKSVQSVLEENGLIRELGAMEIAIVRKIPNSDRKHRLPVAFNPKSKRVPVEADYAILPGDTLLVKRASHSPLLQAAGSLLGSN